MSLVNEWVWPDVSIWRKAQMAIDEAFWVAVAGAVFRAIWVLIAGLLVAICFGRLAVGIRFRSRVAAVIAFALYVFEILYSLVLHPRLPLLAIVVAFALFAGVRGMSCSPPRQYSDHRPEVVEGFKPTFLPAAQARILRTTAALHARPQKI